MTKEIIKVIDKHGFHYGVTIEYFNNEGFANALYEDRLIAQCNLNKLREPFSDNDMEWEAFEERLSEWKDEMKANLIPDCEKYFNNQ